MQSGGHLRRKEPLCLTAIAIAAAACMSVEAAMAEIQVSDMTHCDHIDGASC